MTAEFLVPASAFSSMRREAPPEELAKLKRRLKEHVSREEYELAAALRDQLRALEK